MLRVSARGFALVFLAALLAFSAVAPVPVLAESAGSGGSPSPADSTPTVDSGSTTAPSSGLSAAQLLELYLSLL
jgi:hypothetical protein